MLRKRYERVLKRVDQVTSEDVFENLMNAYARAFDPHSSYFSPRNSEEYRIQMSLNYDGIGASLEGYGLTEASPVTHCNPVFGDRRAGTIGLPLPNTDAAIRDRETGMFLPVGEQGELVVRGPQVTQGYWGKPDETAKTLHDGWLLTGDIAVMSEDGYFSIVDRAKDMIIVGGLKVFPRQVEDVLFEHPKVLEAAVVGVPDAQRGERVQAFIVLKPGESATAEELTAFCRERLAP